MASIDVKWFYYFIFKVMKFKVIFKVKVIKIDNKPKPSFVYESKSRRKNLNGHKNLVYKDYI